jgi:hypothetical protein
MIVRGSKRRMRGSGNGNDLEIEEMTGGGHAAEGGWCHRPGECREIVGQA